MGWEGMGLRDIRGVLAKAAVCPNHQEFLGGVSRVSIRNILVTTEDGEKRRRFSL